MILTTPVWSEMERSAVEMENISSSSTTDSCAAFSAADRVFSTYELLEAILLYLVPITEMLDDDSVLAIEDHNKNICQALSAFLPFQRVNWFWHDVICDSRLIQTSLFMRESHINLPTRKLEFPLYDSNFLLFDKCRWLDKDFSRLLKYAMAFRILQLLGEDTRAFVISYPASTEVELAYAYLQPKASWQRMHTSYYHQSDTYNLASYVGVSIANGSQFASRLFLHGIIHASKDGSGLSLDQLMKEIARVANAMSDEDRLHIIYHFRLICRLGQWDHDLAVDDILNSSKCYVRVDIEGRDYFGDLGDFRNRQPTPEGQYLWWSQPKLRSSSATKDSNDGPKFQTEVMPSWLRSHPLKIPKR
jgi:hypothetical protein